MQPNTPEVVLDHIYDGVYFVDRDRVITYWNKGAERLTHFTAAQVVGTRCSDNILNHVDDKGENLCKSRCPVAMTLEDGLVREAQVALHHRGGHLVKVCIRVAPVRDENGVIVGAVESFCDDSARNADIQKLEQLQARNLIDPQTGLAVRSYVESRFYSKFSEWREYQHPVGLFLAAIDGCEKGQTPNKLPDDSLRTVGGTLAHSLRAVDLVGRWAENELLGLTSLPSADTLLAVGEQLRRQVEQISRGRFPHSPPLTVSIGMAFAQGNDTAQALLERVKAALDACQHLGGNRVMMAGKVPSGLHSQE